MELKDQFTTVDEDEIADRSAIFYLKEQDLKDLILALDLASKTPQAKFSGKDKQFGVLRKQFKNVLG